MTGLRRLPVAYSSSTNARLEGKPSHKQLTFHQRREMEARGSRLYTVGTPPIIRLPTSFRAHLQAECCSALRRTLGSASSSLQFRSQQISKKYSEDSEVPMKQVVVPDVEEGFVRYSWSRWCARKRTCVCALFRNLRQSQLPSIEAKVLANTKKTTEFLTKPDFCRILQSNLASEYWLRDKYDPSAWSLFMLLTRCRAAQILLWQSKEEKLSAPTGSPTQNSTGLTTMRSHNFGIFLARINKSSTRVFTLMYLTM